MDTGRAPGEPTERAHERDEDEPTEEAPERVESAGEAPGASPRRRLQERDEEEPTEGEEDAGRETIETDSRSWIGASAGRT